MPVIQHLVDLRQKDQKFKVILRYTEFRASLGCVRPCLLKNNLDIYLRHSED